MRFLVSLQMDLWRPSTAFSSPCLLAKRPPRWHQVPPILSAEIACPSSPLRSLPSPKSPRPPRYRLLTASSSAPTALVGRSSAHHMPHHKPKRRANVGHLSSLQQSDSPDKAPDLDSIGGVSSPCLVAAEEPQKVVATREKHIHDRPSAIFLSPKRAYILAKKSSYPASNPGYYDASILHGASDPNRPSSMFLSLGRHNVSATRTMHCSVIGRKTSSLQQPACTPSAAGTENCSTEARQKGRHHCSPRSKLSAHLMSPTRASTARSIERKSGVSITLNAARMSIERNLHSCRSISPSELAMLESYSSIKLAVALPVTDRVLEQVHLKQLANDEIIEW